MTTLILGNSVAKLNLQGSPIASSLSNPSTHRDPLTPKQVDYSHAEPNEWPGFDRHEHISPALKARIPPISKQRKPQSDSKLSSLPKHDSNEYNGDIEGFEDSGDFQGAHDPVTSSVVTSHKHGSRGRASKAKGHVDHTNDASHSHSQGSDDGEDSSDRLGQYGPSAYGPRLRKGPSSLIYPDGSADSYLSKVASPGKSAGIRAGGGIGDLGVIGQSRVARQYGRGRGAVRSEQARWMDGGAVGECDVGEPKSEGFQPHSPRGAAGAFGPGAVGRERQYRGAYESKFERDTKASDQKYDDVDIDDMSEANDDNSVLSDASNDISPSNGKMGRKQRSHALGKLKRRMKNAEGKQSGLEGDAVHLANPQPRSNKIKGRYNVKIILQYFF